MRKKKPKKLMDKEAGREELLEVRGILNRLHVPFFLIMGTALGAVRDGGFVPAELDIDLGFLSEDFIPKADEIRDALQEAGYQTTEISEPFTRVRAIKADKRVHFDLVSYALWKDKRFCSSAMQEYSIVHERAVLENWRDIELFGVKFNVPADTERYLELEYGKNWRVPQAGDNRSRTRVYGFRKAEKIPADLLVADSVAAQFMFDKEWVHPDDRTKFYGKWEAFFRQYRIKFDIARRLRPKKILEIGVRAGYSLSAFLQACPYAEYIGYDNNAGKHGGASDLRFYEWALERARRYPDARVTIHKDFDTQAVNVLPDTGDFIHVDGDHSYAGAMHDLELAQASGAKYALIDDYVYIEEVRNAVDDWLSVHKKEYEVIDSLRGDVLICLR